METTTTAPSKSGAHDATMSRNRLVTAFLVGTLFLQACGGSDDSFADDGIANEAAAATDSGSISPSQGGQATGSVTIGDTIIDFVPEICSIRENGAMLEIAGTGTTLDGATAVVSLSRQQDQGVDVALGSVDIGRESLFTPADPAQPSFRVLRPDGQEGGGPSSFDFDNATGTYSGSATASDDNGIATSGQETLPISWTATC